jgi:hypothetical protein
MFRRAASSVTNRPVDAWLGSVSLWKATDLTPLGSFSVGAGTNPYKVMQ